MDGLRYREGLNAVCVAGGVAGNVIPDACTVTVNYRFAPDRSPPEAEAHVREVFAGFEVEVVDSRRGALPGLGHPAAQAFVAAVGGEARPKFGWTDVARFSALGVPAVNYGPGDPSLAHTREEYVEVAQLIQCEGRHARLAHRRLTAEEQTQGHRLAPSDLVTFTTSGRPEGRPLSGVTKSPLKREEVTLRLSQACLTALTSRVILTLSLTRMPPASRATFQVRPKSLRLIVVSPENPARVLPHGSATMPSVSTAIVTDRVTSLTVRSPTSTKSSPSMRTSRETNESFGNASTSRKSPLRTWVSRSALPVSTLAASIET